MTENEIKVVKVILLENNTMIYVDGKRIGKCPLPTHTWKIKREIDDIHDICRHVKWWYTSGSIFRP